MDEIFVRYDSWIHRMDPRARLITALIISVSAALSRNMEILGGYFILAILLVAMAKLPPLAVLSRLKSIVWFIIMLWLVLPLTYDGEPVWHYGALNFSRPGVILCAQITLKAVILLLYFMALLSTMTVATLGHGMHRLHMPDKLVFLLLMTYRYLAVIQSEYQRLLRAVKFRGFVPGTNIHSYRTYAYLAGMLFVRASRRASRVYDAMRCRGFNGKFHTLDTFSSDMGNHLLLTVVTMIALGLVITENFLM